jgi:hypothetical protein
VNALELGGIEFLRGDDSRKRGEGVRFFKDKTAKLRKRVVEHVAGSVDVALQLAVEKDEDLFDRPINDIAEHVMSELKAALVDNLERILHRDT